MTCSRANGMGERIKICLKITNSAFHRRNVSADLNFKLRGSVRVSNILDSISGSFRFHTGDSNQN